jgi:hypothetical protein
MPKLSVGNIDFKAIELFLVKLTTIHTLFNTSQTIIRNSCYDKFIKKQGVIRHDGV